MSVTYVIGRSRSIEPFGFILPRTITPKGPNRSYVLNRIVITLSRRIRNYVNINVPMNRFDTLVSIRTVSTIRSARSKIVRSPPGPSFNGTLGISIGSDAPKRLAIVRRSPSNPTNHSRIIFEGSIFPMLRMLIPVRFLVHRIETQDRSSVRITRPVNAPTNPPGHFRGMSI